MKIKKYDQFLTEQKENTLDIPNDVLKISEAYRKAGKDIFLVGGAVRDYIQGITPKDYDLVTNALIDESKEILKDFNVSDEQGKSFGVIRVYTKECPEGHEIASYRKDISGGRDTKGEEDKVEMGQHITMEDDCNRRDLTMNALYYDINKKEIIDLVGGVDDIKKGIVKAVGNASERFLEDRLRILRIFRFTARTGGRIDKETSDAIKKDNRLIGVGPKDDVSQERIWEELEKSYKQSKKYNDYLSLLTEYNMWGQIFPGSNINTNLINSDSFLITISNLFKNEETTGLSNRLVQNYKMESDIVKAIIFLINLLDFKPDSVLDIYKKKLVSGVTDDNIREWVSINNLDNSVLKFIDYKPSVSAKDLMEMGFERAALGIEIKRLETEKFKKL